MPHTLRTERLLLRPSRLRDARAIANVFGDIEVTQNTSTWSHPVTEDMVRWRLTQWLKHTPPDMIGFTIQMGRTVIGQLGINHNGDGRYTMGYTIGMAWWGQGYGTEAVRALCDHAFRTYPVRWIDAEIFADNFGSIGLARKCGFEKVSDGGTCWSTTLQESRPSVLYRRQNPRPI